MMQRSPRRLRDINARIDAAAEGEPLHGLDHVVDPSTDMIRVVNSFADFCTLARRFDTCSLTLHVLAERVKSLQETLLKPGGDALKIRSGYNIIQYCIILYNTLYNATQCKK